MKNILKRLLRSALPHFLAVFIFDPEEEVCLVSDIISRLYGLTLAETRLTVLLMKGKTLDDVAMDLGVAKDTVRKQLQRIFAKTNTNRQSELLRLLARGTASLHF